MPPSWTATAITCAMNPDDAVSGPRPVWSTHGASRPWMRSEANVSQSQSRPETSRLPPNSATPRRPSRRIALPPSAMPFADQSSVPSRPNARSAFGMNPSSSSRHASPSPGAWRSNSAAFASVLRRRNDASPSGNAVAVGSSVFRYSRPRAASSSPSSACAAPPTQSGCQPEKHVVVEAGLGDLGRADAAAEPVVALEHDHVPAGAREQRAAGERVDPAPDEDDVRLRAVRRRHRRWRLPASAARRTDSSSSARSTVAASVASSTSETRDADGQLRADDLVPLALDLVHHDPARRLDALGRVPDRRSARRRPTS